MAQRRMLDKNFILSDSFTALPPTAQLMYMRLILCADDEGFVVNAKTQQRIIGARHKPLEALQQANLIHIFDSGVTLVLHWNIHNKVRKNTFTPTIHQAEKALVTLDNHNIYVLKNAAELSANPPKNVTQDRVGKDRTDQERRGEGVNADAACSLSKKDFEVFWEAYPNQVGKTYAQKAFEQVEVSLQTLLEGLENHKKSRQWRTDNGAYIPKPENWLRSRRWEERLAPDTGPTWGCSCTPGEAELEMVRRIMADNPPIDN